MRPSGAPCRLPSLRDPEQRQVVDVHVAVGRCPGEGEGGAVGRRHTQVAYGGRSCTHRHHTFRSHTYFYFPQKSTSRGRPSLTCLSLGCDLCRWDAGAQRHHFDAVAPPRYQAAQPLAAAVGRQRVIGQQGALLLQQLQPEGVIEAQRPLPAHRQAVGGVLVVGLQRCHAAWSCREETPASAANQRQSQPITAHQGGGAGSYQCGLWLLGCWLASHSVIGRSRCRLCQAPGPQSPVRSHVWGRGGSR